MINLSQYSLYKESGKKVIYFGKNSAQDNENKRVWVYKIMKSTFTKNVSHLEISIHQGSHSQDAMLYV